MGTNGFSKYEIIIVIINYLFLGKGITMEGLILKSQIVCSGLKQWQIAKEIGWSEPHLSRVLRGTVSQEDAKKIRDATESLKNKRSE